MACSASEVAQSCPTLCDPMGCSPPGSSIYGIFQARVLESVAISFSRGYSWPGNWTQVSRIVGRRFIVWATREAQWPVEFWKKDGMQWKMALRETQRWKIQKRNRPHGIGGRDCSGVALGQRTPYATSSWRRWGGEQPMVGLMYQTRDCGCFRLLQRLDNLVQVIL